MSCCCMLSETEDASLAKHSTCLENPYGNLADDLIKNLTYTVRVAEFEDNRERQIVVRKSNWIANIKNMEQKTEEKRPSLSRRKKLMFRFFRNQNKTLNISASRPGIHFFLCILFLLSTSTQATS